MLDEADLVRFSSELFPEKPIYRRFVNEARFGLSRILPVLSIINTEDIDVLEVGGGSCILSAYLASKGLRVTALEPLGPEFDFFFELQKNVLDFCRSRGIQLNVLRMTGEQLDLRDQFSVAFTINALEHMQNPLLAVDNILRSLKSNGVLLAHCPNYTVPFDSHFNILLVTRSKWLNGWLYRSRIKRYPSVWDELNLIRYVEVRRHLSQRGASFIFSRSTVRDSVMRLLEDPIFAERMPLPVRVMGAFLRSTGLVKALSLIPVRFQSPMEVLIRKP
jgi:SAM-dependent methyltransferase